MKQITIVGFGNQAKAWALNLRDSGWKVSVALRDASESKIIAKSMKFETISLSSHLNDEVIVILTPDETHLDILKGLRARDNSKIIYAHGYSLLYNEVSKLFPQYNHLLLAPKAIASELRYNFEIKKPSAGVISSDANDETFDIFLKDLAKDIGITYTRCAPIADEVFADLFSEQSLLCSILPFCSAYSFEKLVESGIDEEVAYFECWHEVALIAKTMIKMGPMAFFNLISPNALVGAEVGKSRLLSSNYHKALDELLENIKSGKFNEQIENIDIAQIKVDMNSFWSKHPLEKVHRKLKHEMQYD